nr:hypothetical protein [uncultured Limnohabitans sp.]
MILKICSAFAFLGVAIGIFYLKNIGFYELTPSITSSGVGGAVFAFGFGVFTVLMIASLLSLPWVVVTLKKLLMDIENMNSSIVDQWYSKKYILAICFISPSASFVTLLFDGVSMNEVICYGFLALASIFAYKNWRRISFVNGLVCCSLIMVMVLYSLFPLIIFLSVVAKSTVVDGYSNIFQYLLLLLLNFLYAACVSYIVDTIGTDGWSRVLEKATVSVSIMAGVTVVLIYLAPNLFLNGVAYVVGIRENQTQVKWHYVDKSEYSKFPVGFGVNGFKDIGDNKYFCSFNIFSFGEHKVLCPFDVENPNAKTCIAFAAKNVSIVPVPNSDEWRCQPPKKNVS